MSVTVNLKSLLALRAKVEQLEQQHPGCGVELVSITVNRVGEDDLWCVQTGIPYRIGCEQLLANGMLIPHSRQGRFVFGIGYTSSCDLSHLMRSVDEAIRSRVLDSLSQTMDRPRALERDASSPGQGGTMRGTPGLPSGDLPKLPFAKNFLERLLIHDFGAGDRFRYQVMDPFHVETGVLAVAVDGLVDPQKRKKIDPGGAVIRFGDLRHPCRIAIGKHLHPCESILNYALDPAGTQARKAVCFLNRYHRAPEIFQAWEKAMGQSKGSAPEAADVVFWDGRFAALHGNDSGVVIEVEGGEQNQYLQIDEEDWAKRRWLMTFLARACHVLLSFDL